MSYNIQIQFFFDGDSGQYSNGERWVTVEEVGIDPYGRLIVNLENQDGSLNERMKQRGYR